MQNGLWISDRESFLQRTASNHHEVILKYLVFKDQFSQKWQLYPVLVTVYDTGFFQHNSFCTGHRLMKNISHLIIQCSSKCVTLSTAASLPSASWTPSHCHTHTSNFFVMGAPTRASFCCLKAASQIWSSQPVPLQSSALYRGQLGNRVLLKAFFSTLLFWSLYPM